MLTDPKLAAAFMQVLEAGSFEKAAAGLHLSPSAVSQRIRRLESQTGCLLLTRNHPPRPTEAGRRLLAYLRRADMLAQEMQRDFGSVPQPFLFHLAANYDALETWLVPVLAQLQQEYGFLCRVSADDQEHTLAMLTDGRVHAAISSSERAAHACEALYLGSQRYRLLAGRDAAARWFAAGVGRETLRQAPLLVFNHKDRLQHDFLQRHFDLPAEYCPIHHIPSSQAFYRAVCLGLGYGLVPDSQSREALARGELVDLAPGRFTDIPLYWHSWQITPPLMQRLCRSFAEAAAAHLEAGTEKLP